MSFYDKIIEKMKCSKFFKQESGSIFVLTALLLPLMFGCLGIAYDVGNLYMHKARLQNVTDAAALAGGRAFLESQKKTTGTKDDIDVNTDGKAEKEYVIGGSQTLSGKHQDADKAADDYIYKNIINLGEKVYSDKYSHYALRGIKKNAAVEGQEATYTAASEIFYRVGLRETVPLYFLSVITKKNVETVRAGSVVVLQPGTTTVIPGSGGTGSESGITSPSIFDNLFTFSEWLFTQNITKQDGTSKSSFTGTMVYTHLNNMDDTPSNDYYTYQPVRFYNAETDAGGASDELAQTHLYEDEIGSNIISSHGTINDPTIDTFYDTKAYLDAFRKKLLSPHVELNSSNSYTFEGDGYLNASHTYFITGLNERFYYDGTDFYVLDTTTYEYKTITSGGEEYQLCYTKLGGIWDSNAQYVLCAKKKGETKYYLVDNNGGKSNYYINKVYDWSWENEINLTQYQTYGYTSNHKKEDFVQDSYDSSKLSNIYHVPLRRSDNQVNDSFYIKIDKEISGDVNTPIYVLIDGINAIHIEGSAATNRRPLILVFLSEKTTQIKYNYSGEFVGTIYAPISTFEHFYNNTGTFRGNVIAKTIKIEADKSLTFIQENFLENYRYDETTKTYVPVYVDEDIKKVSDATKEKIEQANKNANLTEERKKEIYTKLGLLETEIAAMESNSNWYNEQTFGRKKQLYANWRALYDEYAGDTTIRDLLWPWNKNFGIEGDDNQTVTTDETLRLINYRTEYQTKDDGSIEDGKVLDPFIFETLGKPDSY